MSQPPTRSKYQLNSSRGIQQYSTEIVEGSLGLYKARGLLSDIPPGLRVPRGTTTKFSTIGYSDKAIASLHTIYSMNNGTENVKIVVRPITSIDLTKANTGTAGASETITNPTNVPDAAMLYSSAYFREELIFASENAAPASLVLNSAATEVTASSLSLAPKGGLVAGHQNRLWVAGCSTEIEHETLYIPCSANGYYGGQSSRFEILATEIDFGKVVVFGASARRSVPIYNGTDASVKVVGVTCSGTDFLVVDVPSLPVTVPPGGMITIGLQCLPEAEGTSQATLMVTTNMPTLHTGTAWTTGTLYADVTLADIVADQLIGCYLLSDDDTLQYEITDNDATGGSAGAGKVRLTLNSNPSAHSGDWKIVVDPTVTCSLKATATYDPFIASPNFVHFNMVIKGATDADYPTQIIAIANPMSNSFYMKKPVVPAKFTVTHYSVDDTTPTVDFTTWTVDTYKEVPQGKSLRLKIRPNTNIVAGVNEYTGTSGMAIAGKEASQANRVWFSELKNSNKFIIARDYIDFRDNEGDGGRVMALVPYSDALWVFCRNAIWAITGYSADTFRRQEIPMGRGIGIINPRAWCIKDGILFFAAYSGIYAAMGMQLQKISDPIADDFANVIADPASIELAVGGDFIYVSCKFSELKPEFGETFTWTAGTRTVTVAGAAYTTNAFAEGTFYDKAGTSFTIASNGATTFVLGGTATPQTGPFLAYKSAAETVYALYVFNTVTKGWTRLDTAFNRMCSSYESDGKPKLLMCKSTLGTSDVVASIDTASADYDGYNDVEMEWGWDSMQDFLNSKIIESIEMFGGYLEEDNVSLWFQSENTSVWKAATMIPSMGSGQIQHRTFIIGPQTHGVFWRFKLLIKDATYNGEQLGAVINYYRQAGTPTRFTSA